MSIIDIIILVAFIPAVIKGIRDGFVRQTTAILGLFMGVWIAYRFSNLLAIWLGKWAATPESITKIVAFVVILIIVMILINLIGKLLENVIKVVMLGWLNKLLGVLIAFLLTAIILGIIISLINYINTSWFTILSKKLIDDSTLYTPLSNFTNSLFPYLKHFFKF